MDEMPKTLFYILIVIILIAIGYFWLFNGDDGYGDGTIITNEPISDAEYNTRVDHLQGVLKQANERESAIKQVEQARRDLQERQFEQNQ